MEIQTKSKATRVGLVCSMASPLMAGRRTSREHFRWRRKYKGSRRHIAFIYEGPVMNHDFKNFELKSLVMTRPGSSSGIYFHTEFQQEGLPDKGFEVQVNNSHTDWRTGGLYDIKDTKEVYVKDDVWFTEYIRVEGKHVIVKLNDKVVTDWTQPDGFTPPEGNPKRIISDGTFASHGHDPKSIVFFKDIMVKPHCS